MTISRDQGTPCVELQIVVWVLDKEVLREPAGSKTELVTADVYLSQLKNCGCCQCKLPAANFCRRRTNTHSKDSWQDLFAL